MTTLQLPDLFTPATAEEHSVSLFTNADLLGLSTSTWAAGGVTRTTFAVMANVLQMKDVAVSLLNQGGFLDYAATGSVTYTDHTGELVTVPVTPDPSNPSENPDGTPGALDVLASSVYNLERIWTTSAGGTMLFANTSATTYGPFAAGAYHVAQPSAPGSPTYSNTETLSIAPSAIAGTVITAATNASPIAVTTSTAHGLTSDDVVLIAGVLGNTASNGAWTVQVTGASSFTLDGSTGNGVWTSGGIVYVPTSATFTADSEGTPSNATTVNVITSPVTSLTGVSCGNVDTFIGSDVESNVALAARCRLKLSSLSPNGPSGAYEFFALSSQARAPLLTPPQAVAAAISRALVQTDYLTGQPTTTIANAAGAPSAGDVTATAAVIQANCVPTGITAITQAAVNNTMPVLVTAYVPAAYQTSVVPVLQVAVQVFFQLLPIGGVTDPSGPSPNTNVVPINAILGACFAATVAAKIPMQDAVVTLDGGALNVQLAISPIPEVAVLSPAAPTITVTIVT
jgi:phage-related baseplate assembly protein